MADRINQISHNDKLGKYEGFGNIGNPVLYKKGVINDNICDDALSFYGAIPLNGNANSDS